jgi:integrase
MQAADALKRSYGERDIDLDTAHVFVQTRDARHAGKPVLDVKDAFHTAPQEAGIEDFTWHDFRHDYASRLVMAGVSLRACRGVVGPQGAADGDAVRISPWLPLRRGNWTPSVHVAMGVSGGRGVAR